MKRFFDRLTDNTHAVDTHYRIGLRVVKTVGAITICLLVAWLLGSRDSLPIAAIAALVTMQATQRETLKIGIHRILGTLIGGIFGIITVIIGLHLPYFTDGLFLLVVPVVLLLNLYLCNFLNMRESCTISCVVTLIVAAHIITESTLDESLIFTLIRLRDTFIGVVVATVVNIVFAPYKKTENGQSSE